LPRSTSATAVRVVPKSIPKRIPSSLGKPRLDLAFVHSLLSGF
jgi:hypothetical protein